MQDAIQQSFMDETFNDKLKDIKNEAKDTSLYNIRQRTNISNQQTQISSTNINSGNNFNTTTSQDTTIIASNISAGTADTTPDKSHNTIAGQININAQNLTIAATQQSSLNTSEIKTTRTISFNNFNSGNLTTTTINSNLNAKNDNFNFDVANEINLSYYGGVSEGSNKTSDDNNNTINTPNYITHIKNNNDQTNGGTNLVNYTQIENTSLEWHDTLRGLTDAGTAAAAIAATAAVIVTAGAASVGVAAATAAGATATGTVATASAVATTAIASSAASTAAISAPNTSMNADGNILNQAKDIGRQTLKDTTSKESLENMAISGATAFITAGIAAGINELSRTADAANAANSTQLSANQLTNTTLTSRFTTALQQSAIQTISSTTAQSAITGESFNDTLRTQLTSLLINAAGQVVANEIGQAAHTGQIDKPTQLALHAGLGCGMALAGSNNCAAGVISGITGELSAEFLNQNTNLTNAQIIEAAKIVSALASAAVAGPDDGNSVFAGSQIGGECRGE